MRSRERCIEVLRSVNGNANAAGYFAFITCQYLADALEHNHPFDAQRVIKFLEQQFSPTLDSLIEDALEHWGDNGCT